MELGIGALIVWCVVAGGIGAACASGRNRAGTGLLLGVLLGPLGWIIALVLPSNQPHGRSR